MLPLMASVVTTRSAEWATVLIAACIVVPQIVVALISPWVGHQAQIWGRRWFLLAAFAALAVRGLLFSTVTNPQLAWMGKPYSNDLRERVVAAVQTGELSCNQAAKQFGVAISTAINWVRRLRETGSIAPGKMGGHKPKAISGAHRVWLLERIKDGDFTLRGLVVEFAERGLKVDYRSVWEFVHAEKLSFKKKRGGWRTRSPRRGAPTGAVDKVSRSRRA